MKNKILIAGYVLLSIFVIVYLLWLYFSVPKPEKVYYSDDFTPAWVEIPPPKEIVKIKTQKYPVYITQIVIVPEEQIVEKIQLPEWLKNATETVILNIGEVPPYKGKTQVYSLLNTKTGEGQLYMKRLPYRKPFIEFKKDLYLFAGWDFVNSSMLGELNFTFLRISKINLSLFGIAQKDKLSGGLGIWMEF
jgi:hypothetical protein